MSDGGSRFASAGLTDVGRMRSSNQDAIGHFVSPADGSELWIVADGMGGHQGGEIASQQAVQSAGQVFASDGSALDARLARALGEANVRVHEQGRADPSLAGMGTTVVALAVRPGRDGIEAWMAHVGDSRGYRLRGRRLSRLTDDHSVVGELVRRGHISEEEARTHPQRNEILRALGTQPQVDVEMQRVAMEPDDRILLCSDGLCGVLDDPEMERIVRSDPPESAVRKLVDEANAQGGPDNVSAQVIVMPGNGAAGAGTARLWALAAAAAAGALLAWWLL